MYYIRKFTNSLWHQYDYTATGKISGEAVTISLAAKKNELSLWRTTNLSLIEEEGLLALLGSMESLDTVDIIIFEKQELIDVGLTLIDTPGATRINALQQLHTDIIELDLELLTGFAHLFANRLHEGEVKKESLLEVKKKDVDQYKLELKGLTLQRYTKSMIKTIINKAIDDGRIDITEISERIVNKLDRT